MGLEGISSVDVFTLKASLQNLNSSLTEEQALFLARYIAKGAQSIAIENVLEVLHLADSQNANADREWEEKFLSRLKKKMYDKNIFEEELESKFRFHDKTKSGFIEQT